MEGEASSVTIEAKQESPKELSNESHLPELKPSPSSPVPEDKTVSEGDDRVKSNEVPEKFENITSTNNVREPNTLVDDIQGTAAALTQIIVQQESDNIDTGISMQDGNAEDVKEDSTEQQDESNLLITKLDSAKTADFEEPPPLTGDTLFCPFSDEELNAALQKYFKNGQVPSTDMRHFVISYARKKSVASLIAEDYDLAARCDDAVNELTRIVLNEEATLDTEQYTKQIKDRLDGATAQQKYTEQKWNDRINSLNEEHKKARDLLLQQQESEKEDFEAKWSRAEAAMPFSKPSSKLLQLRRMQKAMAVAKMFTEAKQIKQACEKLQKEETLAAQERARNAMMTEYAILMEKHERELDCSDKAHQRRLSQMMMEKEAEMASNSNLQKQLTTRLQSPVGIRRPQTVLGGSPTIGPGEGLFSHRTRSRYAGYRKGVENVRLDVKIIDPKVITKSRAVSPVKVRSSLP